MKSNITAILILTGLLSGAQAGFKPPDGIQDGKWPIFVEDVIQEGVNQNEDSSDVVGRIHRLRIPVELLPATSPLDHYVENLRRIAPQNLDDRGCKDGSAVRSPFDPKKLQVKSVGQWHDYEVFDVLYKVFSYDNTCNGHRSIVLRDAKGNHRILYTQFSSGTSGYIQKKESAPRSIRVSNQTILAYSVLMAGDVTRVIEYYFLYDEKTGLPVPLDLAPALLRSSITYYIINKFLPNNRGVPNV